MNDGYVKTDPWRLVEDRFDPSRTLSSESLFALGNGVMGGRANFEERYSGETLQGNYIGGVYYPDKTRVGWWKNGYPEYFAKVPNAAFWIGVDVAVDGEPLDLTYLEYALLAFLATHPGRTYSRDALLRHVWGFDYYGGSRTVDVHVRRIRAKLGPELAQHLETVRGVYLWN